MVATISALTSSAGASVYYESENEYYAEGGLAPSEWQGEGAAALGLSGEVEHEAFRDMLDGKLPDGQQLGAMRDGSVQHRPGWDVTMSAPKSVSIMAEVAGDRRLIVAHDKAVSTALAYTERHAAATRIREDNHIRREQTGNLAIASFRHDTSRAQDPQLHTHNVIMNATCDADGHWRSLEPRALYQMQKSIGAVYRQELAAEVRALGYEIEAGKESLFEIKGVPQATITAFSERAAQVEARLAERGKTRATASAEEKQIAALDTRVAKESTERGELVAEWRVLANEAGFDQSARLGLIAQAEQVAAQPEHGLLLSGQGELRALSAVQFAAESLGERQSVFSSAELEKEAGRFGLGLVTQNQVAAAIDRAIKEGQLEPRTYLDKRGAEYGGFTTATNINHEQRLLRAEVQHIDTEQRTAKIRLDSGRVQTLGLDKSTDQHIRHGYVQTAHAAQGRTAERVMIHADSRATNLVDQRMMYVAISRAKSSAAVYTDDRVKLVSGIKERAGEKQMALGNGVKGPVAEASRTVVRSRGAGLG